MPESNSANDDSSFERLVRRLPKTLRVCFQCVGGKPVACEMPLRFYDEEQANGAGTQEPAL